MASYTVLVEHLSFELVYRILFYSCYVDQDDFGNGTLKRLRKDSFYWYKKVIETNGEEL